MDVHGGNNSEFVDLMSYYVKDFQGEEYALLQDSQDVDAVMEHLGIKEYGTSNK